eukprot:13013586-Alexandrium_andersonii.AAC.1
MHNKRGRVEAGGLPRWGLCDQHLDMSASSCARVCMRARVGAGTRAQSCWDTGMHTDMKVEVERRGQRGSKQCARRTRGSGHRSRSGH